MKVKAKGSAAVKRMQAEGEREFESEMVTLERIGNQKEYLRRSWTGKTGKMRHGQDIQPHSLAMRNISFGVKGRFEALLSIIQTDLQNAIKHFSIEGSSIQSKKLAVVL